ncbi:MAG: hypothetical protein ABIH03_15660, partial [Pseudomonadota bacterium]
WLLRYRNSAGVALDSAYAQSAIWDFVLGGRYAGAAERAAGGKPVMQRKFGRFHIDTLAASRRL